jgi:hypothetical protein
VDLDGEFLSSAVGCGFSRIPVLGGAEVLEFLPWCLLHVCLQVAAPDQGCRLVHRLKKTDEELEAGLSAKLGNLLLMDKEASGLVIKDVVLASVPKPRWAVVGKVCSPRKLIIGALEHAMHRAWGLHHSAQFKDIGDNRFVVRFNSEGDRKHVMKNGPWQFDFNAVLLKDYDGSIRPSDIVFDYMDMWVRVSDLPLDMMNKVYGQLIGNWLGKFVSVDVDDDGIAWGEEL